MPNDVLTQAHDRIDKTRNAMMRQRDLVLVLLEKHARKARESEYDRAVCISAISAARDVVTAVPNDGNDRDYAASVLSRLCDLMEHYHDPDGVYTSGKGVLGALVSDIHLALRDASD